MKSGRQQRMSSAQDASSRGSGPAWRDPGSTCRHALACPGMPSGWAFRPHPAEGSNLRPAVRIRTRAPPPPRRRTNTLHPRVTESLHGGAAKRPGSARAFKVLPRATSPTAAKCALRFFPGLHPPATVRACTHVQTRGQTSRPPPRPVRASPVQPGHRGWLRGPWDGFGPAGGGWGCESVGADRPTETNI